MAERQYCYLDWAATSPLRDEVAQFLRAHEQGLGGSGEAWLSEEDCIQANANSLHTPGRNAFKALEEARLRVAGSLGLKNPHEIVFCSGATEANNSIIWGSVLAAQKEARLKGIANFTPHIITTSIEHDSVLAPLRYLHPLIAEVSFVAPNADGFVSPEALSQELRPETILVSVMCVNNEIGVVQDIKHIVEKVKAYKNLLGKSPLMHSDMVQALGKISCNLGSLQLDAASFSGHKIQGPKGVGMLYLSKSAAVEPFMRGGGQELNRRSGTQPVIPICAFAKALELACLEQEQCEARLRSLRDYLYEKLEALGAQKTVSCPQGSSCFAPHIVNVLFEGVETQLLILQLDRRGFAVSGGSACSSSSLEASHVLKALNLKGDKALGSLRISFGADTTKEDLDSFISTLAEVLKDL